MALQPLGRIHAACLSNFAVFWTSDFRTNNLNSHETTLYYQGNRIARWTALIAVCIGSFISPLTLSASHLATPAIAQALNADAIYISWIPTAFLICSAITLLPMGRLADNWGRKRLFLIGCSLFTLCSILTALAPNIELLLIARGLQGIASSMIFGPTIAIVTAVFDAKQRGTALGLVAASVYLGLTCGPAIGGWMTDALGWQSVFLFPVPLMLITIVLLLTKVKGDWRSDVANPLDWVGSLLFASGCGGLFWGLSGLPSPAAIGAVVGGIALIAVFVKQQERAKFPLVRLKAVLNNRMFTRSLTASVVMYAANYPLIFIISLYLQFIKGMSASDAGQLMLIQAAMMAIVAPIAGRLSDRYEPRMLASFGCLMVAIGFGLLQMLGLDSSNTIIFVALAIIGLGFGFFSTPNNNAAIGSVRLERLGIASAVLTFSRVAGNMLGTGLLVFLMNFLIGQQTIVPALYPTLLLAIKIALGSSLFFAIIGSYFSFKRD